MRAEGRQQELAMRAALGASRGRLRRTLVAESVVLALAGGVVGVALAWASIRLLRTMAPAELPRVDEIGIDVTVLVFTLVVSVLSGAVFGLFAAWRFGSPSIAALKEGGRSTSDAPARHRTRQALVVGQVALALTLLMVSGLLIRTFVALRQVDPGFTRPEEVQTFVIAIPRGLISDAPLAARTFQSVAERLSQVPGVASVGLSSSITMDGEDERQPPRGGRRADPKDGSLAPAVQELRAGILRDHGHPADCRAIDHAGSEIHERRSVIVISEPLAREVWGEPCESARPPRPGVLHLGHAMARNRGRDG